jgi:chromosome segregation ATPase
MAKIEIDDFQLLQLYDSKVFELLKESSTTTSGRLAALEAKMTELSAAVQAQSTAIQDLTQRIGALDSGALQTQVDALNAVLAERDDEISALNADEELDNAREADFAARLAEAGANLAATAQDVATNVDAVKGNTAALEALAQPNTPA